VDERRRNASLAVAAAVTHARAVLAVLDEEIARTHRPLAAPARLSGGISPETRARAGAAVRDVERSLAAIEPVYEEAMTMARDWRRRAELASAEGRADLAAQAEGRATESEETGGAYAAEVTAGRTFLREWAAYLGDVPPHS
jgi:hypothetical protein